MKVFDLVCSAGHRFEGWFASADDFAGQTVRCPVCDVADVTRAPSAPRLNLGADGPSTPAPEVAALLDRVRRVVAAAENVGPRFAEEARRIHYEEVPARSIRGTATDRERRALEDEGIETMTVALPPSLTETLQ
jgi:hypothetical protein